MDHGELYSRAEKRIQTADHMLTQTYPHVQDPKMLLSVVSLAAQGMEDAIASVLSYERMYKQVPPYRDELPSMATLFARTIQKRFSLPDYAGAAQELAGIIAAHKESPVEFRRKDSFVICDDDYHMKTITTTDIASHLSTAKGLLADAKRILTRR